MSPSMRRRTWLVAGGLGTVIVAGALATAAGFDLWIHPRGDEFDPKRHYKDADGELYYHAENDIHASIDLVVVDGGEQRIVKIGIGPDLFAAAEPDNASLLPLFLYDSDGDGQVDRTLRGRLEGRLGIFDSPTLSEIALRKTRWQIGVRYEAYPEGRADLDGRYLASVDSRHARIAWEGLAGLPDVGADVTRGLVIFKHREGEPFDFADFIEHPAPYLEGFTQLTRQEDDDDWTVGENREKGTLRTHLGEEDLFIVRTEGGYALDVKWGDMPVQEFMENRLLVPRNGDGCYSTLDNEMESFDGADVEVPNRLLYCPDRDFALFDAPPGYQIFLSAMDHSAMDHSELDGSEEAEPELFERTEASTSIRDNLRLYANEAHPRRPSSYATGSIGGNIKAGYGAAGGDLMDALRHLTTGTTPENTHTGERHYRASPITMVPRALIDLGRLQPIGAISEIWDGVQSTIYMSAHLVGAANNAVLNPLFQVTVGPASTTAATKTGDVFGVATVAFVRNTPVSDRSVQAYSPVSAWRHNRAFAPSYFTRSDTQMNIDRILTALNVWAISSASSSSSSSSGDSGKGNGNGGGGGMKPPKPPKMLHCPPGRMGKVNPIRPMHSTAFFSLPLKFLSHPTLTGCLPIKF